MKKRSPLLWLIPLILLLLLIPFIVPSALPVSEAEEDLPEYVPVDLACPEPGTVPTEEVRWESGKTRLKPLYPPDENGYTLNERGSRRGYLDGTISVRVEERTIKNTRVLFTWIQIADPSQLRAQFAHPYPSKATFYSNRFADREQAVVSINGDYCTGIRAGVVWRNGQEFRTVDADRYDQLIVDTNGDFHILKKPVKTSDFDAYEGRILHSFIFGPALVVDGKLQEIGEERDYGASMTFTKLAQRQAICQMDTLSYLIVTTEGPEQSDGGGFTMYEFAQIVYETGAVQAYNMDGGSSTKLQLGNEQINNSNGKSNKRRITDLVYFVSAEPGHEPAPESDETGEDAEADDAESEADP